MIITLQTLIFFRESLISVIDRLLRPYYKRLSLQFKVNYNSDDDGDSDEHVFAEFDDEKGVVFYPPVYAQRYAAVVDCLMDERWCGKLEKVVDFGYHDMSFIKYLKEVPGIKHILGVDIETIPVRCSSDLLGCENYVPRRENPLQVTLFQGNAADPDYRLIGCDAVIAIEMIEHMLPHDLERFVHTVFGFIKPRIAIFTTPNGDFNVLFKALEKNGLRRLDHFFEWSREQFHDWCSNIVARYPQYTVMSKGIGPGPPDTLHLGCCSQLVLFVAKDYQKQPELNLDSMALVAKAPSPNNLSDMTDSWENPDSMSDNMLCIENNDESYSKLLINQQSYMTIVITSPTFSLENLGYQDKILQCNLESELGKNFLMFDDEVYFNVIIPRRKKMNRIYEIEDVASRLNCSMIQVKKFSKATQGLIAKNKTDKFAHTREVVDEIRQLTKMLNFNKDRSNENFQRNHIWCNINWGENAPYWNQYYKIVREYNYPFEVKSDECRILDAISEEINILVDKEYPEGFSSDNNLEIPIDQLMKSVEHITTNVDEVKELLQWNGYDIVNNLVLYTRLAVDNISLDTQEDDWQEDALSDWDTSDVHSNSITGSTAVLDHFEKPSGRCLRRALDQKVCKLRTLLTADEDITTELDRIVCRLMKLALYSSTERLNPPPISWMQWKLFDLLTLTEKAIERRRRHYLENYSVKAIEYCNENNNDKNMLNTFKARDNTVNNIVSKYNDVVTLSDFKINEDFQEDQIADFKIDNTISVTSNVEEFVDHNDMNSIHDITGKNVNNEITSPLEKVNDITTIKLPRVENNDNSNFILVPYPSCVDDKNFFTLHKSNDSLLKETKHTNDPFSKTNDLSGTKNEIVNSKLSVCKVNEIVLEPMYDTKQNEYKIRSNKTKTVKKVTSKIINVQHKVKRRKIKDHQQLQSTLSKPIPDSLMNLYTLEQEAEKNLEEFYKNSLDSDSATENINQFIQIQRDIAATEDSLFIGVITEYGEESIALRRNIGVDPAIDFEIVDNEILETVINITKEDDLLCNPNIECTTSQTIFIYDINEPSTSKGVRNLNTDAQCGPDVSLTCATISATTSLTIIGNVLPNCIKIENSHTDTQVNKKTSEFGTCTELMNDAPRTAILPIATGIKIKDSDIDIYDKVNCSSIKETNEEFTFISNCSNEFVKSDMKLLKSAFNNLKIEEPGSEPCSGIFSIAKSPFLILPTNANNVQIQTISKDNIVAKSSQISYVKQNLICGGVHMHSLSERLVSEDVVYQGEWQRMRPIHKKKSQDKMIKRSNSLPKKKTNSCIEHTNTSNALKNFRVYKPKKMSVKPTLKNIKSNEANKKDNNKNNNTKNIIKTKIASKINKTAFKTTSDMNLSLLKSYKNLSMDLNPILQNKDTHKSCKKKNYLPMYLRRTRRRSNADCDSKNKFDSRVAGFNKDKVAFFYSMKEEITKELLKFTENIKIKNDYMVCRNENEIKSSSSKKHSTPDRVNNNISPNRNGSPSSQNSSTCSSPNSVATVRAVFALNKPMSCRRGCVSSDRTNSAFEAENKYVKNKNYTKRYKSTKKPTNKSIVICSNKENIPESSKNIILSQKEISKPCNNTLVGKTKSVFMAQATTDKSIIQLTSGTITKSNFQNLNTKQDTSKNKQAFCLSNASISKNKYNLVGSYHDRRDEGSTSLGSNNNVSILQSIKDEQFYPNGNAEDNSDILDSPNKSVHSKESSIIFAIRQLIEQKIHITDTNSHDSIDSGSETIILNRDDIHNISFNSNSSPLSISTVIANEDNIIESDVESASIDLSKTEQNDLLSSCTDVKSTPKEIDLLSCKSSDLSSVSTSKFSEYYLADNEFDNTVLNLSSVQDIFERNDRNITNVDALLAAQAFSGFSINTGSFLGDRLDNVNLIDSETGSITLGSERQTVSEELFVSGRSSDTYESCLVEDDTYVPNWLFNIISRQPSIEESEVEEDFNSMPILPGEPEFDVNGNLMEPGVGIGAGAGDGRGMHSDQSQDSSGRGTSLSSSATSSGQSEAILIDLSAITANQPHYIHEPINIPGVDDEIDESHRSIEGNTTNDIERARDTNVVQIASDVDADISSLDTDAIDSDD